MSDNTDFDPDVPTGWNPKKGAYRLNTEGATVEYLADGRYRAICEVVYDEETDDFEYATVVFERGSDRDHEIAAQWSHQFHQTKSAAAERLSEAMRDLQTTITAPVEHWPDAHRRSHGSREVSAVDHNGDRYCLDCARDHSDIDIETYITEPSSVAAGGPVFIDTQTEMPQHCGQCQRQVETHIIGNLGHY